MFSRSPARKSPDRRGTATVELAVCLPVLVLVTLGAIEATNAIYLKQALTSIAYEGVRAASSAGGTTSDAEQVCQTMLAARNIRGATFTCTPITASTSPGTPISVNVTASVANNSLGVSRVFRTTTLTGTATMPRL